MIQLGSDKFKLVWTIFFFLLVVLPYTSKGQRVVFIDEQPYTSTESVMHIFEKIDSLTVHYDSNLGKVSMFKKDSTYYILIDGFNYVFRWNGDNFVNLYKGKFHGHNFLSYKFVHEGLIHSYGGYGFWAFHPEITYFDPKHLEWELKMLDKSFKPKNESFPQAFTFYNSGLLYVGFNREVIQILKSKEYDLKKGDNLFRYDFSTSTWSSLGKVSGNWNFEPRLNIEFDSENYYFQMLDGISNVASIINKNDLKFKRNIEVEFNLIHKETWKHEESMVHVKGDKADIYLLKNASPVKIDLDSLYNSSNNEVIDLISRSMFPFSTWYLSIIPLLVIFGILVLKKKSVTRSLGDFPYPSLLKYFDSTIDQKTIDHCLGIDLGLSEHSARNKRSKLIEDINLKYSDVLTIYRVRSKLDARIFEYEIQKG